MGGGREGSGDKQRRRTDPEKRDGGTEHSLFTHRMKDDSCAKQRPKEWRRYRIAHSETATYVSTLTHLHSEHTRGRRTTLAALGGIRGPVPNRIEQNRAQTE